ncbi:MAG TPA: hypothetical protein VJ723_07950 [Candidatus Angelobacter sp.]|nr:hypothetical protein [Candidatus Angelobacter sp.]
MKSIRTFSIALCILAVCAFLSPAAVADQWNQRTIITFSAPVEVPGVGEHMLPAGTYVFKLMDSTSNRNIVQIFNAAQTHVYTTVLAIPNYRLHVTDNTVITFWERAEGQPQAIRAWFYPGENWGQEFVYPKSVEVAQIAAPADIATPIEAAPAPAEEMAQAAPPPQPEPQPEPQQPAPMQTEPAQATPQTTETTPAALPQTASFVPLFALTGLLSLSTGFALWMFSKRSANHGGPVSRRVH